MNGKELKVVEYNLTFGSNARLVNVFGLFRYKKNNSLYVIYTDVAANYNIVYYGSSHVKGNNILCMSCKEEDIEIIKEYIYKISNNEELDNFEIISLDDINGIEIITSNRLEIKPEVLSDLIEKTIPKKEEKTVEKKGNNVKKKGRNKALFLTLFLVVLVIGVFSYLTSIQDKKTIAKMITCEKTFDDRKISASVSESNIFYFNNQDTLENIETTDIYKFNTESDYQDFINKGTMYKYMPDDSINGGYKQDDENYSFTIVTKEEIDINYDKPTKYEEVLSYNKREGYTCDEKLVGE